MKGKAARTHTAALEIIVLGSGTCVPTGSRGPASYAVTRGGKALLIDTGGGCLEKLARCGISFKDIEGVILSHYHVDHTSELPLLLFANNFTPGFRRTKPLTIFGPEGLNDFLENLEALYRWVKPLQYEIIPVAGKSPTATLLGDVSITSCPAEHGDGRALSVRLDAGSVSVTYSGDTGYSTALVKLARDTDVLIIECSYRAGTESDAGGHLTPYTAAKIAEECNAGKVILTHLYPDAYHDDPKSRFLERSDREVIVAHDFLRITL